MTLFLKNSLVFCTIISIFFLFFFFVNKLILDKKFESLAKNYPIIIMGDSQIQRLPVNIFKEKSYNLANKAEHYFFTYNKLKKLLSHKDCNLKLVLIGISPHNFSPIYHKLIDLENKEGLYTLKNYAYFINIFENQIFSLYDIISRKEFYQGILKGPLKNKVVKSSLKNPNNKNILQSIDMYYSKHGLNKITNNQTFYLKKIVNLCKKNGIKVTFLTTPSHRYFKQNIPQQELDKFYTIIDDFNQIHHINFFEDSINDSLMSDGNHLNINGAKFYSKLIFKKIIENEIIH